jgi:hypothetical protein
VSPKVPLSDVDVSEMEDLSKHGALYANYVLKIFINF